MPSAESNVRHELTHDPEIKTWAEIKSQMLNWLSHPGDSKSDFFNYELNIYFMQKKKEKTTKKFIQIHYHSNIATVSLYINV